MEPTNELRIPIQQMPLVVQAFGDTMVITDLQTALIEGHVAFQLIFQQRHSKTETPPSLTFRRLAEQWRKETRFISPVKRKVLHPAYQQIIGMGEVALPLILRDLEERPGDWLWALRAIAGEDPATENDDFRQAVKAWLRWGKERGYI